MAPKRQAGGEAGAIPPSEKHQKLDKPENGCVVAGSLVPVQAVRVPQPPAAASSTLAWQPVAAGAEVFASTFKQMQGIVPLVLTLLPGHMELKSSLADISPLQIAEGSSGTCGYKEIWNPARCQTSLTNNGVYEAGGNLFWLDTQLSTAGTSMDTLHRQDPGWPSIVELADQFFSSAALDNVASVRTAGVSAVAPGRLIFPLVLDAWASDLSALSTGKCPSKLNLASGHALVWAWYYAMMVSLHQKDGPMVRALYDCALSTTIRVRVLTEQSAIVLLALRSSESHAGAERALSDTFLGWSDKVLAIVDSKLSSARIASDLERQGVTFLGSKVSKQMVLSAQAIVSVMSPAARAALLGIDRAFGRSVVGHSYAKLQTVARLAKVGNSAEEACELAAFVFGMMFLSMLRREVTPKFFRTDVIEKNKHDGSPGWFHMTAAKRLMVKHLIHCARCLEPEDSCDIVSKKMVAAFGDPLSFRATFCPVTDHSRPTDEGDAESQTPATLQVDAVLEGLSKPAQGVGEILHSIYCGQYDREFKMLAAEPDLPNAVHACFDEGQNHELGRRLRAWMRSASSSTSVVSSSDTATVPGLSIRQLVRLGSEGGVSPEEKRDAIERERADLWRKAVAQRQRFVQFALLKTLDSAAIAELVKKAGSVSSGKFNLNEAHRGFFCSMDLLQEADSNAWVRPHTPRGPFVDACLAFLAAVDGPADFCFAFDGRSRAARRTIEDAFSKCKHTQEMWVVYRLPDKVPRKVCFASEAREAAMVRLPCARVRLHTKPREAFVAAGEQSTHDTTWTAVPACPVSHLPRMSIKCKKEIFSGMIVDTASPPKWKHDGVPFMWNEVKSARFWESLLVSHDITVVVDLSPGSGQLASAAMKLGLQYVGIVVNRDHLSWLTNSVDRCAARLIAENGSPLFQQELAEHLSEQFAEVLCETHEADLQEGGDEEEEDWPFDDTCF